jgi:microcin C transport system substrate-binding protein
MVAAQNAAPDNTAKVTAIHALDRLLLNGWYLVPFWTTTTERVAYWDRVQPQAAPVQQGVDFDLWWAK